MNGPTIWRPSEGSTRLTTNPPKSRSREPITCRIAMCCPGWSFSAAIMTIDRAARLEFICSRPPGAPPRGTSDRIVGFDFNQLLEDIVRLKHRNNIENQDVAALEK